MNKTVSTAARHLFRQMGAPTHMELADITEWDGYEIAKELFIRMTASERSPSQDSILTARIAFDAATNFCEVANEVQCQWEHLWDERYVSESDPSPTKEDIADEP